jgi:hypothetical protein
MSFFAELKRRNVFRVGAAYLVVAWLLMQVTDTVVPALHLPGWIVTAVVLFLIIGLPLALVFAWAFELTPEGLKREAEVKPAESISHRTGRKLDYLIIGALAGVSREDGAAALSPYAARWSTTCKVPNPARN